MRLTALTVLTYVFTLQLCVAAPRAHHVMLSWKPSGKPWHFAFYSTLPLSYSLRDVTHPDMIVIGVPALKQRLSQHDPWRDIVWRDLVGTRPYPDVSTRDEICAFARTHGVNLEIVPDGFTIDVTADGADTTPVSLPLVVHADLTANPKGIENFPNLDSYLDAVVTEDGRFVVKDFHLGTRKQSSLRKSLLVTAPSCLRSRFCRASAPLAGNRCGCPTIAAWPPPKIRIQPTSTAFSSNGVILTIERSLRA